MLIYRRKHSTHHLQIAKRFSFVAMLNLKPCKHNINHSLKANNLKNLSTNISAFLFSKLNSNLNGNFTQGCSIT